MRISLGLDNRLWDTQYGFRKCRSTSQFFVCTTRPIRLYLSAHSGKHPSMPTRITNHLAPCLTDCYPGISWKNSK